MKFQYKNLALVGAVAILGATSVIIHARAQQTSNTPSDATAVTRQNVVEKVEVSGRIEPAEKYDLSFGANGVINSIRVKEGDTVYKGQILATLDSSDVAMQRAQANAVLVGDRENADIALKKSQDTLKTLQQTNTAKLAEAKKKLVDAEKSFNNARSIFNDVTDDGLSATSPVYISAKQAFVSSELALGEAKKSFGVLTTSLRQAEVTAKNDVTAAQQVVQLKQDTINESGSLSANRANVAYLDAVLGKSVLRASASGIVATVDASIGEYATPAKPVVSVITPTLITKANVSESEMAKLAIGNTASITLDAYGNKAIFPARITAIDQIENQQNGINSYGIELSFDSEDDRLKSGLTANIAITTNQRDNAVAVPSTAIITANDKQYVMIKNDALQPEKREVKTGLYGADGFVEIISGLEENETILSFATK